SRLVPAHLRGRSACGSSMAKRKREEGEDIPLKRLKMEDTGCPTSHPAFQLIFTPTEEGTLRLELVLETVFMLNPSQNFFHSFSLPNRLRFSETQHSFTLLHARPANSLLEMCLNSAKNDSPTLRFGSRHPRSPPQNHLYPQHIFQ